jgi:hypothetical protein
MPTFQHDGQLFEIGAERVIDAHTNRVAFRPYWGAVLPPLAADTLDLPWPRPIVLPGEACADPYRAFAQAIRFACLNWDAYKARRRPRPGDKVGDPHSGRVGRVLPPDRRRGLSAGFVRVRFADGEVEEILEASLVFMP